MKSKLIESDELTMKFPVCMRSGQGVTVLFSGPASGTVVHSRDSAYQIGWYSDKWEFSRFSPLLKGTKIVIEP